MLVRRDNPDKDTLARNLADAVVADLAAGLADRGQASLAVSGGSTPKLFFKELSGRTDIDWSKVTVTLVDERWVDESSDRSNGALVRANLLQDAAADVQFVPLYAGGDTPDSQGVARANAQQALVPHPYDAVILGMGNDGHTASFFPGGDTLEAALTEPGPVLAITAPGAGEPRVTQTLPRLLATRSLYLHIEGAQKAATLAEAIKDGAVGDMPVRAVLRNTDRPATVFWCP